MAKTRYHHGDLRTALLDAAEKALNEEPTRDLSIRSLATELAVSATAPHAHFKSKADLLEALALRGFEQLRLATADQPAEAETAYAQLHRLAEAYLRFGFAKPGLFKIMFTTGVTLEANPDLFRASRSSYAVLQDAIERIYPEVTASERNRRALAAWSLVHGLTALLLDNRIQSDIIDDRSPSALAGLVAATVLGMDSENPAQSG